VKGAGGRAGLAGGFPFSIDAGKSAGVEQAPGLAVGNFEEVLAEVGGVESAGRRSGPDSFKDQAVESEVFLGGGTGMDEVQPQRARRLRQRRGRGRRQAEHAD
jgi:hypothetical protein